MAMMGVMPIMSARSSSSSSLPPLEYSSSTSVAANPSPPKPLLPPTPPPLKGALRLLLAMWRRPTGWALLLVLLPLLPPLPPVPALAVVAPAAPMPLPAVVVAVPTIWRVKDAARFRSRKLPRTLGDVDSVRPMNLASASPAPWPLSSPSPAADVALSRASVSPSAPPKSCGARSRGASGKSSSQRVSVTHTRASTRQCASATPPCSARARR
jgi:hypothetical protein